MKSGNAPSAPLEIQLLWPELSPEPIDEIDSESCAIAEKRAQAFRLYTKKRPVRAIAEEIKVSPATASRYVRHVLDAYLKFAAQDAQMHLSRELGKLAAIESELWEAWERSKSEQVKTLTGRRDGQNPVNEAKVERLQRDGSTKIMGLILDTFDRRCKLLGLIETERDSYREVPVKLISSYNPMDGV